MCYWVESNAPQCFITPCEDGKTTEPRPQLCSWMEQSLKILLAMFVQIQARRLDLRKLRFTTNVPPQLQTPFPFSSRIPNYRDPPSETASTWRDGLSIAKRSKKTADGASDDCE